MFCGYQEKEEYEDELYHVEDEGDSGSSEMDSELEFQLYSQLHYCAKDQKSLEDQQGQGGSEPSQAPQPRQRKRLASAPPAEVIVIDSGPDTSLISDNTEDSVCTLKGRKSLGNRDRKKTRHHASQQKKRAKNIFEEVVVIESESDKSSEADSVPPYVTDLVSDSDSDSDVVENWMILGRGTDVRDQDIQLNISAEVHQQQDVIENGGDVHNWAVSEKDLEARIFNKGLGLRRCSNRYYTEKMVTCHNCNKIGHLSKNCPTPKKQCCSLCGLQGHFIRTCPSRHCSNCSLPGHTYDDCLERAYWHKFCHRCGMTGHFFDACPEIWRQYHITTRPGLPVKAPDQDASKTPAYCYNCSKQGHFGYECRERRMFNGTYPTLPFVCTYNTSGDFKHLEHRIHKQAKGLQEAGLLEPQEEPVDTPQPPPKKPKYTPKSTLFPFTPTGRTSKKRIAHTPKTPPSATPKANSGTPPRKATPIPKLNDKKKNKKKNQKLEVSDTSQDFPRSLQKSPHSKGKHSPAMLFKSGKSSEKSKKKKNKAEKRARKAAHDRNHQASDENLFLIKQRKRSR